MLFQQNCCNQDPADCSCDVIPVVAPLDLARLLRMQEDILYLLHQPWSASHVLGHTHVWQEKILFWCSLPFNWGHTFRTSFVPFQKSQVCNRFTFQCRQLSFGFSCQKRWSSQIYSFLKNTFQSLFLLTTIHPWGIFPETPPYDCAQLTSLLYCTLDGVDYSEN